jgi:hypothetical protein
MGICCSCSRELVSKKKIRTKTDDEAQSPKGGVNLDLTLIHPRIVCMGIPAVGLEAWYRNPYDEVKNYLDFKFGSKYWVYNLCSEQGHHYGPERFDGRVSNFPFPDHHASPLEFVPKFTAHALAYLRESPDSVVCIHCKAGKGRTGQFASSLLMCIEPSLRNADDAITYYGRQRTSNGRGLTIPSQIRYVHYHSQLIEKFGGTLPDVIPSVDFSSITFKGIIGVIINIDTFSFDMPNGDKIVVPVTMDAAVAMDPMYNQLVIERSDRMVTFHVGKIGAFRGIRGDVRLNMNSGGKWKAALTFHTLFLEPFYSVAVIDQLYKTQGVEDGDGIYLDFMETIQSPLKDAVGITPTVPGLQQLASINQQ